MWIFTPFIIGGILLFACIFGSIGILCTHDRRDLIPGLFYGLPVIIVSLMIFVLFVEMKITWANIFTVPSLIMGSLVVWRGFRVGKMRRDLFSAAFVCGGVVLLGFVFIQHPEITRAIFSRVLPPAPIL